MAKSAAFWCPENPHHLWLAKDEPAYNTVRQFTTGYGKATLSRGGPEDLPAERVQLTLSEAFYLAAEHDWLSLRKTTAKPGDCWSLDEIRADFTKTDPEFPFFYAAYRKFRNAGWAPHSGLKYSADMVLYKVHGHQAHRDSSSKRDNRRHEHSPFCVVLTGAWRRKRGHGLKLAGSRAWASREAKTRIVRQVRKRLVNCTVHAGPHDTLQQIEQLRVSCLTTSRWNFPKN